MFDSSNRLVRRTSIIAAILATIVYLSYRGLFTLNFDGIYAIVASVSLYIAEVYGCFLMFLYFFQIWELVEPEPVPPLEGRTVDVYIPTYNEDPELLRGTISAAVALDYPHETYVLDDGNRQPVAALAAELGATYINRPSNLHAKAGNLNHAMEITEGEFVVIFDADHVSRQDFITRLLGYFEDDKLGFIQTPHSFYNFDNFHGMLNYKKQTYWEEGELFYNVIQPGKNYWNGVSFCGSAAMFRRSALVDVGLVATETITEDMHTGLRMHAKGWKSLFVNERLVSGQAATDVSTFNTQRLRWGEGNLGIFAFDNPLTMPGLTIAQRICYLGSMLSWTTGLQKLQLYIAPMLMLLTGIAPVAELSWSLGIITVVYMMMIWTAVTVTSNGHGHLVGTELTHMAAFWTQIQSCYRAVFKRKKTKFVVTAKRGRQTNSIRRFIMPQCLYIAGSALAIAWASTMYAIGLNNDLCGLCVGSTLLLIQCWFAWQVIRRALREKDADAEAWRHPCALNVQYDFEDAHGARQRGSGVTCDINEEGIGFHAFADIPQNAKVNVTISAVGMSASCQIEMIHKSQTLKSQSRRDGNAASWRYGAKFVEPSTTCLAVIWRLCSDYATARLYDQFESHKKKQRPNSIEAVIATSEFHRRRLNLPLTMRSSDGQRFETVTEGLSALRCVVLLKGGPKAGESLRIDLESPLGTIRGTAFVSSVSPVVLGCSKHNLVGLEFERLEEESRSLLLSLCNAMGEEKLSGVVSLRPPERQLPYLRPAALAGTLALAASLLACCSTSYLHWDDWLLANAIEFKPSVHQHQRLNVLLEQTLSSPVVDEIRLTQLHAIFQKLDDDESVARINDAILKRSATTFIGKLCRAQTLDGLQRFDESKPIYRELIQTCDGHHDANALKDLFVSAARNLANQKLFVEAVSLFDRVKKEAILSDPALRQEYVGLLATAERAGEAVDLLERLTDIGFDDRLMLAYMLAADHRFVEAIKHCKALLLSQPHNTQVLHLMADSTLGQEDFSSAIAILIEMKKLDNPDVSVSKKLALATLWSKQPQAITMLEPLLISDPKSSQLQRAFLESTFLVNSLTDTQTKQLIQLATVANPTQDCAATTELLVSSLSRFRLTGPLIPHLTALAALHPESIPLRMQLVDALEAEGNFGAAETLLQGLMAATAKPSMHGVKLISSDSQESSVSVIFASTN